MLDLTVIVPTIGRSAHLVRLLPQLARQLPEAAEVLVLDQSDDAERARGAHAVAACGDRRITHHHLPARGLPAARNRGVERARGAVVLFLDDDVALHPGCLDAHLRCYADPDVGGVVGRICELALRSNAATTQNRVGRGGRIRSRLDGTRPQPIETLKGANMSFRAEALRAAGPFDEGYGGTALLEDADMSERVRAAGWVLRYCPEAGLDHLHAPVGGVRRDTAQQAEWWRFHNTGYFVRRHRGWPSAPPVALTFGAIAVRRAVQWRSPTAVPRLLRALGRGWRRGASA